MRTVVRRLRQLEIRITPPANLAMQRMIDLLRERRRRRFKAAGGPSKTRYVQAVGSGGPLTLNSGDRDAYRRRNNPAARRVNLCRYGPLRKAQSKACTKAGG